MQTIGKYVAALIVALTSSFFGPSENIESNEKEAQIHKSVIKTLKCTADVYDQSTYNAFLV